MPSPCLCKGNNIKGDLTSVCVCVCVFRGRGSGRKPSWRKRHLNWKLKIVHLAKHVEGRGRSLFRAWMAHEMTSALGSQEESSIWSWKGCREPDQAGLCMHFKAFGLFLRAMQLKGSKQGEWGGDTIRFVIFKCLSLKKIQRLLYREGSRSRWEEVTDSEAIPTAGEWCCIVCWQYRWTDVGKFKGYLEDRTEGAGLSVRGRGR